MALDHPSGNIASLPKAELHLHLEGSIQPKTVCALTRSHGVIFTEAEVRQKYAYQDFNEFLEVFKWVTSFLRDPRDYALITNDLCEHLLSQGVVYAEITLSIGIMILRKQTPEANFEAMLAAAASFEKRGLRVNFIFDAVRQFGVEAAMQVVRAAQRADSKSIVAFGIGGDELAIPTKDFRAVYEKAGDVGLHRLMHAGEIGGPEKIREAIEFLGAERIGHGISAGARPCADGSTRRPPYPSRNLSAEQHSHRRPGRPAPPPECTNRRPSSPQAFPSRHSGSPLHRRPRHVPHHAPRRI